MATILRMNGNVFPCSTPEKEGVRSADILAFLDDIKKESIELHSLYVFRHGKLIASGTAAPFTEKSLHRLQSAGKTLIGIAVLIAIQEGYLSLDDRVIPFFSDRVSETYDKRFDKLTIYHLLCMCSGHDRDTFAEMVKAKDWVKAFFDIAPAYEPGTYWLYNNGIPHILALLVELATGKNVQDYLQDKLIKPMELNIRFGFNSSGELDPAVTCLSPESMAKFVLLFLQEGNWNGVQLVDRGLMRRAGSSLVPNSVNERPDADSHAGYGFQLWRNAAGGFRIAGGGGQYGLVYPDGDLAIVTMAFTPIYHNIPSYAAKRIYSQLHECALPEDFRSYKELCYRLSKFSLAPAPASAASSCCASKTGKFFEFKENKLGVESVCFDFQSEFARIYVVQYGKTVTYECGYHGSWVENSNYFIVSNDYSEFSVIYGESQEYTLLSGGWTNDECFVINVRSYASMGTATVMCDFRFGGLSLTVIPAELRGRNPRTRKKVEFKPILLETITLSEEH